MLKDALLEVAKLKQTRDVTSITEGTRQSRELIEAITSAHKDSIMSVLRKQKLSERENQVYEKEVEELLNNPEYLQALIRKRGDEVRQETS
jgi:predicted HAD superfamily phosphohydrolase